MTDVEADLPAGWTEVALGVVSSEPDQHVPAADETFAYIDIGSIDRTAKVIRGPQRMLGKDAPTRARKKVAAGDTLVSMTRPNLNAVALVPADLDGQIASTGFDVLRPAPGIDPRWLAYLVRTDEFVRAMTDLVQGALYPAVRTKDVRSFVAPIAPAFEQTRIADQLDLLLARIQACQDRLEAIPPLLKRFRQAVLRAAVCGDLTASAEQCQKTECQVVRLGEDRLVVPGSWKVVDLEQVIDPARPLCYGVVQPGADTSDGVPLIRVQDMESGTILSSQLRTVAPSVDAEYRRSRVTGGEVLVSVVGTIGRTSVVPQGFNANIARAIARIACRKDVSGLWVHYWLSTDSVQWHLLNSAKEVARKTLNLSDLARIPIALPDPTEQAAVVERVAAYFRLADKIESIIEVAKGKARHLSPLTLAKAFRGELLPQDPNDEPASALLARFKAARTSAQADASRGRPKSPRKPPIMSKTDKNLIKAEILKLKTDRFSFDELRAQVSGDYETLKAALFELLEEPDPVVRQVFDEETRAMQLVRVRP
jgi:type I restriction enzyme, S subunit